MKDKSNTKQGLLHYIKIKGLLYSKAELQGSWGAIIPHQASTSMLHVVLKGKCEIVYNRKIQKLNTGDLVFLPHGGGHEVRSDSKAKTRKLDELPSKKISPLYEILKLGNKGEETIILCALVEVSHPNWDILLEILPRFIYLKNSGADFSDWIQSTVRIISKEAQEYDVGGETLITRLTDILVVQCIRHWLNQEESQKNSGWPHYYSEKRIGQAIQHIHNEPGVSWTLQNMANKVGMSRTAFSKKFTDLVGQSFGYYLTTWRMKLALYKLQEGEIISYEFVKSFGYESESSFRRAFKNNLGKTITEAVRKI